MTPYLMCVYEVEVGTPNQAPQHFLYFLPLPQGQGSLRPIFFPAILMGAVEAVGRSDRSANRGCDRASGRPRMSPSLPPADGATRAPSTGPPCASSQGKASA